MDPEVPTRPRFGPDEAIARLAARQHGVVSRAQLRSAGIGDGAIARRIQSCRLHRVHRGVYLVGHTVAPSRAREMAAVLACGPRAVVSHRTAAGLWALLSPDGPSAVDVTVVDSWAQSRPGVKVHLARRLEKRDVRGLDGISITSPARTLLDLAAVVPPDAFERALAEAEARRLVRERDLTDVLSRNRGRRGAGVLRAFFVGQEAVLQRSRAERRLLSLVRAAALPAPELNTRLGRFEVDFLWRAERLIVEVDGYAFHGGRAAFERDRRRDAELQAEGLKVMRVTWRQLVGEPDAVIARLSRALRGPRA
jgi:very-short-patch-repair endonuclease/predicted transcriptional regulator of viral defense system